MTIEWSPLRRLAHQVNGGTPGPDPSNWGGSVQWATPVDLARSDGGLLGQTDRTITKIGLKEGSREVPAGSLILSTRAPIGYVVRTESSTAFNQGCRGLIPDSSVDVRFLQFWIWSQADQLKARGSGSTFLELGSDSLASLGVPLRPLDEQRRIAAFLDDQVGRIERVIALRKQQMITAASRTSSAMDSLFDGEAIPVKQLLKQSPCYGVLVPRFVDNGTPFIRIGDLSGSTIARDLVHIETVQSIEYRRTVVRAGDVLVGVVGSIDKSAIVDPDAAGSNLARAVARLVPRSDVPSEVIWGWTKTAKYRDQARLATQTDTAQPTLNMGDLKNFPIHIPRQVPLSVLGDRIVAVADSTRAIQAVLTSSAQLLRERERSLITAAVTGEFDVSSASTRALVGVTS